MSAIAVDDPVEESTKLLMLTMMATYGEEFKRKWSGFTPGELRKLWAQKFTQERIAGDLIAALSNSLDWEHPPTLPQLVDKLLRMRAEKLLGRETANFYARLPDDSQLVAPERARQLLREAMKSVKGF